MDLHPQLSLIIDVPSINSNNLVDPPLVFSLFHRIRTIPSPISFILEHFSHSTSPTFHPFRFFFFSSIVLHLSSNYTWASPFTKLNFHLCFWSWIFLLISSNLTGSISRIIHALTFVRFVLPKNNYHASLLYLIWFHEMTSD